MKLSELLAKPIKVKGGGILNLKGISKHIADKEIGEGNGNIKFASVEELLEINAKNFDKSYSAGYIRLVPPDNTFLGTSIQNRNLPNIKDYCIVTIPLENNTVLNATFTVLNTTELFLIGVDAQCYDTKLESIFIYNLNTREPFFGILTDDILKVGFVSGVL